MIPKSWHMCHFFGTETQTNQIKIVIMNILRPMFPIIKIHSFTDSPPLRSVDYHKAILTQNFCVQQIKEPA